MFKVLASLYKMVLFRKVIIKSSCVHVCLKLYLQCFTTILINLKFKRFKDNSSKNRNMLIKNKMNFCFTYFVC